MTTKPKARRFRLKLGDDTAGALRTNVAPQRAESSTPARTAQPTAAAPTAQGGGQTPARPAAPQPAAAQAAPAQPATPARPPAQPAAAGQQPTARPAAPATTPPQAARTGSAPAPSDALFEDGKPTAETTKRETPENAAAAQGDSRGPRDEDLSGRQLRMAMRVAQRNGIKATSGIDAVRQLRQQGIDPFERSTLMEMIKEEGSKSHALTTTEQPKLPKAYRQPSPPAKIDAPAPDAQRKLEISHIQKDIARRRRRRMALLAARLSVFVLLPTLVAAWYYYMIATPLYATNSEFVIQQVDGQSGGGGGGLASLMGGASGASLSDSVTVQSFLQSRDAMRRLNEEEGFKAYFQQDLIDPLRRLTPDTTDEAAYRLYQDMVRVSYDPTEGIIRMEVIAADPQTSERFARALVSYAEQMVDQLTQRVRDSQMADAQESVQMAEQRMREAQQRVLDLQESYQMLSSEVEVSLLTQQISNLDSLLNQERLSLSDLRANARPNPARLEQAERRVATLERQIAALRASLTQGSDGTQSIAQLQREQTMAESDVATRQMLLAQAMQQLEGARIEANRQVRYLSPGVSPVAPDEATYPRAFENTALAFLIFAGIYLMVSMTSAILREQVTG
ncbi:capsule biosynthesis protein [Pararhodobacter zhoushanensis]|uniref:Capsule biosynthesis protein n=1 Tax=Pararhodobacter zhoushanensis TaxID=2479545 RepID=A0ABT3H2P5_9RHOB|nr:capsule biosynthesis protein [Pararhodobacter zhoushanensis]MCW1934015.1 capsule biosynthesis protein [Pararhodobacter zhoushanensis]